MDIAGIAALAYLVASLVVIAFQVLLALGAPWGAYAMGGSHSGRLPPAMRVAAAVQALVLGVLAIVVLSRAGVTDRDITAGYPWLIWVVVAVSAVSVHLRGPELRAHRPADEQVLAGAPCANVAGASSPTPKRSTRTARGIEIDVDAGAARYSATFGTTSLSFATKTRAVTQFIVPSGN